MKIFWAFVLVLVAATGVLLGARGGEAAPPVTTVASTPAPRAFPAPKLSPDPVSDPTPAAEDSLPDAESGNPPVPKTDAQIEVPIGRIDPSVDGKADGDVLRDPAPVGEDQAPLAIEPGMAVTYREDLTNTPDDPAEVSPDVSEPEATVDSASPSAPEIEVPEGAVLMNDRYVLAGSGTEADPYVISFDMLVGVEQAYAPKEGRSEVPEWIKVLDDKHVRITGFIAFPFLTPQATECMVMLNEWDGCCIGVPPTPYDAIEVQLGDPIDLQAGIPNYGTLEGVFRTDPYLINGWLIGLYLMEDAKVTVTGGFFTGHPVTIP